LGYLALPLAARKRDPEGAPTGEDELFMNYDSDRIGAPLAEAEHLERIAGGSETDVYQSRDRRYVVKFKGDRSDTMLGALRRAQALRAAAEEFIAYLGPHHSIPSYYVVARVGDREVRVLVIQPLIQHARPLALIDYAALTSDERAQVIRQLRDLVRRALACYRVTGHIPDLHGSFSASTSERIRLTHPTAWPQRVWEFLIQQRLLQAHNLLLTEPPDRRVVLVDYDRVRWRGLRAGLYYLVRWLLFWRDHQDLARLARSTVPHPAFLPAKVR
jgi:hypothetical protein